MEEGAAMLTKVEQDAEFADLSTGDGVQVHNTQRAESGAFQRFITTKSGVEVTLNSDFPFEQIALLGVMLDEVAKANFERGERAAQRAMCAALGLPDKGWR